MKTAIKKLAMELGGQTFRVVSFGTHVVSMEILNARGKYDLLDPTRFKRLHRIARAFLENYKAQSRFYVDPY